MVQFYRNQNKETKELAYLLHDILQRWLIRDDMAGQASPPLQGMCEVSSSRQHMKEIPLQTTKNKKAHQGTACPSEPTVSRYSYLIKLFCLLWLLSTVDEGTQMQMKIKPITIIKPTINKQCCSRAWHVESANWPATRAMALGTFLCLSVHLLFVGCCCFCLLLFVLKKETRSRDRD